MPDWLRYLFFVLILPGQAFSVFAQKEIDPDEIQVPFEFYKTASHNFGITNLMENGNYFEKPGLAAKIKAGDTYWLRVDFLDLIPTITEGNWYLKTGGFYEITGYSQEGENIVSNNYGSLNRTDRFLLNESKDGIFFTWENLINSRYLYFKVKFFHSKGDVKNLKLRLMTEEAQLLESNYYSWPEFKKETSVYLFIGAFLFIFVFSFITYFTSKRLDFLFYSLYILCLLIYLGKSAFQINDMLVSDYTLFSLWLHSVLQILINLFYVAFSKYYLETGRNYPKLNKAINWIAGFLIVILPIEAYLSFTLQFDLHLSLMNLHRLVMSVFAILAFIYLLKFAKNALAYFIIIGSFLFTAGSLIMLFTEDKTYMILGSVFEVLLFGLGLNYKMKKSNEEKILLKQSVYDNQISALRAQMNPHFIFNSLSSIQHLISLNKKEAAIKYLSKFSLLMRNLLEGSIEANAVLADEILLLRKYIELEALRFNNSFHYNITLDENIDPYAIEIPTLIVQPFVENAILHGLIPKEGEDKQLSIHFKKESPYLICEVQDNGVGRKASKENKSMMEQQKKSRGINVTEKRLQIINQSAENHVEIIDKVEENGRVTGTLVILKIMIE